MTGYPWSTGDQLLAADLNAAIALSAPPPGTTFLATSGGTMTGPLTLAADPAANLQPVTLQYYNAHLPTSSPPSGTAGGDLTGNYPAPTLVTTAVAAGSYTYTALTVDAKGRLTAASSGVAPPGPATVAPLMDSAAAVGTSLLYARQDHVHASDTSRLAVGAAASGDLTGTYPSPTLAAVAGVSGNYTNATITIDTKGRITAAANGTAGGSVTSISAGTGLSGGTITTSGTIAIANTAVTAGPYTNANITVNAQGQLTAASSGAAAPGPATVAPLIDTATAAVGTSLLYARQDHQHPTDTTRYAASNPSGYISGNQTITLSGDAAGSGTTAITTTLATVNSNVGTFQGLTVNGKGLVTAASNMSYAPLASPTFTGTVTIPAGAAISGYAPLASPTFTGTPTLPTGTIGVTQTAGNSSTALATTAFVATSFAPLASPTFTGTPTLPTGTIGVTQTAGNSSTALATTAFVATSFAPLASPTFSGTPSLPTGTTGVTQTAGNNTTALATTAFVGTALGAYLPLAGGTTTGQVIVSGPTATTPGPLTINAHTSNWSPNLYGSQLLLQSSANNPGMGIADNTGANYVGMFNWGGTGGELAIAGMPLPSDSATAADVRFRVQPSQVLALKPFGATALATTISTQTAATYTVANGDYSLILNPTAAMVLTLPAAGGTNPNQRGRILVLKLIAAFAVTSASANVVPLAGGSASTAIMTGTAGKFCVLQSDGTNWQIMQAN